MGRLDEAQSALDQALSLDPENANALANKVVLDTIAGRDTSEVRRKLEAVDAQHDMLVDLDAKRGAFQSALEKYSPKFEA